MTDIKPGDRVDVTDAFGKHYFARAISGVRCTYEEGLKVHDFPVVYIKIGDHEPTPWPATAVTDA